MRYIASCKYLKKLNISSPSSYPFISNTLAKEPRVLPPDNDDSLQPCQLEVLEIDNKECAQSLVASTHPLKVLWVKFKVSMASVLRLLHGAQQTLEKLTIDNMSDLLAPHGTGITNVNTEWVLKFLAPTLENGGSAVARALRDIYLILYVHDALEAAAATPWRRVDAALACARYSRLNSFIVGFRTLHGGPKYEHCDVEDVLLRSISATRDKIIDIMVSLDR
ncbi:hypothetical protein DXG01_006445 [Tephrocybe rancida]|nr:hypothetical protein DXG01_006445 [Tephrocybe rancida]